MTRIIRVPVDCHVLVVFTMSEAIIVAARAASDNINTAPAF